MNRRDELVAIIEAIQNKAIRKGVTYDAVDNRYGEYRQELIAELANETRSFDFHGSHATFALQGERTFRVDFRNETDDEEDLSDPERVLYSELISASPDMYVLLKQVKDLITIPELIRDQITAILQTVEGD